MTAVEAQRVIERAGEAGYFKGAIVYLNGRDGAAHRKKTVRAFRARIHALLGSDRPMGVRLHVTNVQTFSAPPLSMFAGFGRPQDEAHIYVEVRP